MELINLFGEKTVMPTEILREEKIRTKNKEKCRMYRQKNRKKGLEYRKKYRQEHKKEISEYDKRWQKRVKNMPERRYKKSKRGSADRNLDWNLTFEEFMTFWGKPCHYCGDEIKTIGLDRVDNKKGYTLENVVSCCSGCNFQKGTLSKEVFIKQCKKIAQYHTPS